MHDARYLISHYAQQYLSVSEVGNSPKATPQRSHLMANVLTTGAWLSAPTKKPSFFARLLRAHIESGERRANRVAEAYIAAHGLQKLSDDAERQIGRLLAKAGQ